MSTNTQFIALLRVMALAVILLYSTARFLEFNLTLSPEAQQYQSNYPDTIRSGIKLSNGVAKLAWLAGTVAGLGGGILLFLGNLRGFIPMAAAAPLLAVGAYLDAPQSIYSNVLPVYLELLWCSTSAAWAGAVVLAWALKQSRN